LAEDIRQEVETDGFKANDIFLQSPTQTVITKDD
jgi:hypothetical protein